MDNSKPGIEVDNAIGKVSSALLELRDALVELSLCLKDWQFETDLRQRQHIEKMVAEVLRQAASAQDPS